MFHNFIIDFKVYKFQKGRKFRVFFHFIIFFKVYKRLKEVHFMCSFSFHIGTYIFQNDVQVYVREERS